jgi:hypothetical protein
VLEIGGRPRYYLVDPIGDIEARDTIVRKPIRIYRVVDSCLIVGAREGVKEGGTP